MKTVLLLCLTALLPFSVLAQNPCFVAQTTPVISLTLPGAAGNSPVFVSAGDLNGDGNIDLVTSNNNQTISVLLGNGAGEFAVPVTIPLTHTSEMNALGDVNGDGRLDIVSLDKGSNSAINVLLNSGSGNFGAPVSYTMGYTTASIVLNDWNSDGRLDIVTGAVIISPTIDAVFFAGNGAGGFSTPAGSSTFVSIGQVAIGNINNTGPLDALQTFPPSGNNFGMIIRQSSPNPTFITTTTTGTSFLGNPVLADLNGDGRLDFLAHNRNGATLEVRLHGGYSGSGALYPATATSSYFAENTPAWLAMGDVDGDGDLDAVMAMDLGQNVTILYNLGGGVFSEPHPFDTGQGTQPLMVTLADLNNDGKLDIVTANGTGQGLSVLLNNGFGGFLSFSTNGAPIRSAVGDLNGDGFADIATVTQATSTNISLRMGRSDGSFTPTTLLSVAAIVTDIGIADVNNDGRNDLVLLKRNGGTSPGNGEMLTLPGNGNGTFGTPTTLPVGVNPVRLALADVNKDNRPDALVVNQLSKTVSVLLASGSTFVQSATYSVGNGANDLVVVDVNGDGNLDFLISNAGDLQVTQRCGNGMGGFTLDFNQSVSGTPGAITAADFDSDGRVDVAVTLTNTNRVQLLRNYGNTGPDNVAVLLTVQGSYNGLIPVGSIPTGIALTDVTGDGRPDLVVAERGDNRVRVLPNNGTLAFPNSVTFATGLAPTALVVTRLAGDNKPDIITNNQNDRTLSILGNCTTFPSLSIAPFTALTVASGSYTSLTAVASLFTPTSYTWTSNPATLLASAYPYSNPLDFQVPGLLTPQTYTITVVASNSLITLRATKIITAIPVTLYSLKNGNWIDPTVWSGGYVPTGYEIVEVGHTIQMPVNAGRSVTYAAKIKYVPGGLLRFVTGTRLYMGPD